MEELLAFQQEGLQSSYEVLLAAPVFEAAELKAAGVAPEAEAEAVAVAAPEVGAVSMAAQVGAAEMRVEGRRMEIRKGNRACRSNPTRQLSAHRAPFHSMRWPSLLLMLHRLAAMDAQE